MHRSMKKEFFAIFLFFVVVFILASLLSYHPQDPSINTATEARRVQNIFGLMGAHLAGLLIGLFGLGAYWIPALALLAGLRVFGVSMPAPLPAALAGGLILMITTGALAALWTERIALLDARIPAGGLLGIPLKSVVVRYANVAGGAMILMLAWLMGFMLATGITMAATGRVARSAVQKGLARLRPGRERLMESLRKRTTKSASAPPPALRGPASSPSPWRLEGKSADSLQANTWQMDPWYPPDDPYHDADAAENAAGIPESGKTGNSAANAGSGGGRSNGAASRSDRSSASRSDGSTSEKSSASRSDGSTDRSLSRSSDPSSSRSPDPSSDNPSDNSSDSPSGKPSENGKSRFKIKLPSLPGRVLTPRPRELEYTPPPEPDAMPGRNLLSDPDARPSSVDETHLREQSALLEKKLEDFGVMGKVSVATPGPVITTFEYVPAPGIKINKVVNLTDDLALALRAMSIRIVAPIPGKAAIGIEIPNATRELVRLKEIICSDVFENSKSRLTLALGKDIVGNPVVADLDKMPHLLIAGATGTGKSVGLNAMICSFLYKASPREVKLIMVDPKRIELSVYDGIPHLITPVVTDPKKATNALFWAVKEMERRYELLSNFRVRNIHQYNRKAARWTPESEEEGPPENLPYIVIIIDELADLMMVASRDVEVALTRLAQMARAAGLHLILATQRPSVDVLTGVIKANFPTRMTFQVSSRTDSRTIIDSNGAESLLGNGDMLFLPPGTAKLQRIQGAYICEEEVFRITEYLKNRQAPEYDPDVVQPPTKNAADDGEKEYDERYDDAVALVTETRQASISMVQRHLRVGYNRAARIIEMMEKEGIVGPSDGVRPREVLARGYDEVS